MNTGLLKTISLASLAVFGQAKKGPSFFSRSKETVKQPSPVFTTSTDTTGKGHLKEATATGQTYFFGQPELQFGLPGLPEDLLLAEAALTLCSSENDYCSETKASVFNTFEGATPNLYYPANKKHDTNETRATQTPSTDKPSVSTDELEKLYGKISTLLEQTVTDIKAAVSSSNSEANEKIDYLTTALTDLKDTVAANTLSIKALDKKLNQIKNQLEKGLSPEQKTLLEAKLLEQNKPSEEGSGYCESPLCIGVMLTVTAIASMAYLYALTQCNRPN